MVCIYCGSDGMSAKFDCKGRPYLSCECCNTKVFTRSMLAIAMYEVIAGGFQAAGNIENIRTVAMSAVPNILNRLRGVKNVVVGSPVGTAS